MSSDLEFNRKMPFTTKLITYRSLFYMKKYLVSLLLICICLPLHSKETNDPSDPPSKSTHSNIRFSNTQDFWFVGASTGIGIYLGDHDKQLAYEDRICPKFEIFAAKWFNNSFGARLNIGGMEYKGLTQTKSLSTGKIFDPGQRLLHQTLKYISVNADLLINISNDLLGYQYDRTYSFIPYATVGGIVGLNHSNEIRLSPGFGLLQTFRINDLIDINLDLRGNIHGDGFDGEYGGRDFDGSFAATMGISFKIW